MTCQDGKSMKRREDSSHRSSPPANQGLGPSYLIYARQSASEVHRISSLLVKLVIQAQKTKTREWGLTPKTEDSSTTLRFPNLAVHQNHLGSFKNCTFLGLTPKIRIPSVRVGLWNSKNPSRHLARLLNSYMITWISHFTLESLFYTSTTTWLSFQEQFFYFLKETVFLL